MSATAVQRTQAYARVFHGEATPAVLAYWLLDDQPRYSLPSVQDAAWQEQAQLPHWPEAARLVRTLEWIPWIHSIWITGSVAARSARPDDDVDIMIITQPNRLWLTRLIAVIVSKFVGRYRARTADSEIPSVQPLRWCFNVWVESSAVHLLAETPSLYVARELIQATPILCRSRFELERVMEWHEWIRAYSSTGWLFWQRQIRRCWRRPVGGLGLVVASLGSPVWTAFNIVAYWVQRRYMQPHRSRERVSYQTAFFHPRDAQAWTWQQYETILQDYERTRQLQYFTE